MKYYLFIISIFIIQSCKKKEDTRFTKTWYDTEYRIPGKTILKINSNFSFDYKARGCDWSTFSKGNWKVNEDTIILNSSKIDSCYNMFPFAECIKFGEPNNKKIPTTIPNCSAESGTVFTLFKAEKFYFKNDSLVYKLKSNSNCQDSLKIVFAKTPKKKNGS